MKLRYVLLPLLILLAIYPTTAAIPHISQGDTVYVNDTIDLSGVVAPYPELAYWNGYDMYDSKPSYIWVLNDTRKAYYDFYLDPSVFTTRTGKWYKYDPDIGFESHGNNLAFVVYPQVFKNSTLRMQNGTLFNLSEYLTGNYTGTEPLFSPPVPLKHVSDYVIAVGDSFTVSTQQETRMWLFGRINGVYAYNATNATIINVSSSVLSGFEPGDYKLVTQTIGNGSTNFTVQYNAANNAIEWFDPVSFTIKSINALGLTPSVLLDKFKEIMPDTRDDFHTYNVTLQTPSVEVYSINQIPGIANYTYTEAGTIAYNTNSTAIEVRGYTNVKVGTILTFILDESKQTSRTLKQYTTTAVVGGTNNPGDMRWFDAAIPLDIYNLKPGVHTVTVYTPLSTGSTSVSFNIYESPASSYVPNATIRYIGGNEFVPTPTPVVQTVTQIVTVPVPVEVKVTPSDDQVKAQQTIIVNESINAWVDTIVIAGITIVAVWYLISLYLRRKELDD